MTILSTLSTTIDATGISAPTFAQILESLNQSFRSVYGANVYLGSDSQDGQWLAILASAFNDANNANIAVYNAFSPATAQGAGLSSNVKINGLNRNGGVNSQATVNVSGNGGAVILNGVIGDNLNLGTQWTLPPNVTIPVGAGTVSVLATCTQAGPITAAPGTLTTILTPKAGFAAVTNPAAAVPGQSVESDSTLRQRQSNSTSLPAVGPAAAAMAAIKNLPGVTDRSTYYENVGTGTDGNGLPPRSVAFVVEGGDPNAIATAIALKKFPGTPTYGTTSEAIVDQAGVTNTINFFVLTDTAMKIIINITALPGYVSTTARYINLSVAQFINNLAVGQDSYLSAIYAPARLSGDAAVAASGLSQAQLDILAATYNITSITQGPQSGSQTTNDFAIAFNAAAAITPFFVGIVVS